LHSDRPYNITYGYFTKCYVGVKANKWGRKPIKRVALAPDFAGVLGVTTTLETNLKILSLGDSVGMQFHQLLEEAAGALWQNRQRYQFAWGGHESTSVAAPVDGGGVLAAFRMTGMLLEAHRGQAPPNAGGGGWLPEHVQQLLNHTYRYDKHQKVVERFDAMIFRIPHGWLKLEDITEATLTESLMMAHKLFAVQTAIVLTLPLNNNVKTMEELEQLHQTNVMIRRVVDSWSEESGPQDVLLMDFGTWADQLTEWNARVSGMDTTQSNANYTLNRLGCAGKFPPSLAMICTDIVPPGSCACTRNMISIDGLHWCMESVGGRVIAAIACLLQCPLLHYNDTKGCAQWCNERFMSLEPVIIDE
jgi:hypothetical protein